MAIILPGSTYPLQIVQADRFLDKRKSDPKLPIDEKWDDSVKALVNYPDVVKMMSGDLDWTSALGEAVVADQGAVLEAIQAFRRRAQAAGNLKSNDKQIVEVEKTVIEIVPANPEVIYVPQYNPTTVVVAGAPAWGYYPTPYPVYYYPYAPGAAFATGLIWGAAIGAAWGGGHWDTNWGGGDININRNTNINTGDINRGNVNRPSQRPSQGGGTGVEVGQATGAGEWRDWTHEHDRASRRRGARWRGRRRRIRWRRRRTTVGVDRQPGWWRGRQSSFDAAGRWIGWRRWRGEPRGLRQRVATRQLRRLGREGARPAAVWAATAPVVRRAWTARAAHRAAARCRLRRRWRARRWAVVVAGEAVVVAAAAAGAARRCRDEPADRKSTRNEPDESDQDDGHRPPRGGGAAAGNSAFDVRGGAEDVRHARGRRRCIDGRAQGRR